MNTLVKLLIVLLDAAKSLGLSETDLSNAKELLENHEYGLAFDTVITQLYEYEVEIDYEFYVLVERTAKMMNITNSQYSFINELIRGDNVVPKSVKDRLAGILDSLGE